MRGLLSLLGPTLLFVLALWLEPAVHLRPEGDALVRWGPLAILVLGLFMALRFHRTSAFFGLVVLTLSHEALATNFGGANCFVVVAVLLPANFLLFGLLPERGVYTGGGISRLVLLAIEVAGVVWLSMSPSPELSDALRRAVFPEDLFARVTPMPQAALIMANIAAVVLLAKHMARPSPDTGALAGALVAACVALYRGDGGTGRGLYGLYLGAGGLMLMLAVVEHAYRMAFLDELTGLPGRRALGERLKQIGAKYAVAMVDIDHFKKFNDTWGHDIGDDCLRMVAGRLGQCGGGGEAFRYGGEEFSIIFPGRTLEEALPALEALREAIEKAPFRPRKRDSNWNPLAPRGGKTVTVTVSIGAAGPAEGGKDAWAAIKAADEALYKAKKGGRNKVAS